MIGLFIPTYNGSQYLSETLSNIIGQSYTDWTAYCVDDGSTDNTVDIIKSFCIKDNRIKLYQKRHDGIVPFSWKFIIPHIKEDFVLYMSQDDLLSPNSLERLNYYQNTTDADAVATQEYIYREKEGLQNSLLIGDQSLVGKAMTGPETFRYIFDHQISGFIMWRTDIIRNGELYTDTYNADDLNQRLWMSMCRTIVFSDAPFYYRNDNPNAITKLHTAKQYDDALTNTHLLLSTMELCPNDPALIERLYNQYFDYLYRRMVLFQQNKRMFSSAERERIVTSFRKAYKILAKGCTLTSRKYRIARLSFLSALCLSFVKHLQYKCRGIVLDTTIDTGIL